MSTLTGILIMFQSALRPKTIKIAPEVENLGLEACVEEIKSKLALIERLEFACESFAALPDKSVTPLTVSLFASSFVDVDDKFVPEFSHKSLESSGFRSSLCRPIYQSEAFTIWY